MKKIKQILKKQGFTLVELIIVIAIIAVLAVAAFMMLTKWLGKSRDSRRLSDIGTIARGLTVGYSDTDDGVNMYPTVEEQDGAIALLSGAEEVGYQGVVDTEVANAASMQKAPLDPSDQNEYTYLVTQNRQKFQVLAMLEDETEVTAVVSPVYALDYSNRYPASNGFELGVVLRESDNMPANLIGGGLTGVNLADSSGYKAVVSNTNILVGTGIVDAPIVKEEVVENTGGSSEPTDTEAPIGGDFTMLSTTSSTNINLTVTCPTDAAGSTPIQMYISGTGLASGGNEWESCSNKSITLIGGEGSKNITMKWRDNLLNETEIVSKNIEIDYYPNVTTQDMIDEYNSGGSWSGTWTTGINPVTINANDKCNGYKCFDYHTPIGTSCVKTHNETIRTANVLCRVWGFKGASDVSVCYPRTGDDKVVRAQGDTNSSWLSPASNYNYFTQVTCVE